MSLLFLKFKQSILNEFFPVYTQVTDVLIITKKYKTEQCKFYIYENCRQLYKNEGVFFFPLFDLISLLLLSYTALYFTMCIFNIYIKMSFLWQVLGIRRDHVHFQYLQKCPFYGKFWGLEGNGAGA